MTQHDLELIAKARRISILDWGKVFDLAEQADTEEARKRLRQIAIDYNHSEEACCGLL